MDSLSISECERDDVSREEVLGGDDGASTQENLEEIVSQLLQHNLHLQKLLLSKQRRGLLSRKRSRGVAGHTSHTASETSDTENDDLISHDSGLPITSINSMNSINHMMPSLDGIRNRDGQSAGISNVPGGRGRGDNLVDEYVDLYFDKPNKTNGQGNSLADACNAEYFSFGEKRANRETGSSSEGTSVYSSAVSINQRDGPIKLPTSAASEVNPRDISELGAKRIAAFKKSSTLDDLGKGANSQRSLKSEEIKQIAESNMRKMSIRRAQSFTSQLDAEKRGSFSGSGQTDASASNSPASLKDRRVTIAVYDSSGDVVADHQSDKCSVSTSSTLHASSVTGSTVCEDQFTDCSESVALQPTYTIHPEHKIYTSAILSRHSLKNVMSKLISTRKTSAPEDATSSGERNSLSSEKTPSKLVYTMARQCTKTLKERIKQIRSEDENCPMSNTKLPSPSSGKSSNNEKGTRVGHDINALKDYKQGSSSIGEKLATNSQSNRPSANSQVENLGSETKFTKSDPIKSVSAGVDSCGAIHKVTSPCDTLAGIDDLNLDDSSGSIEEFDDDNSGGDSYYERSFEVIEDMLENDIFRDSAIYSDPEDPDSKISAADLTRNFPRSVLNRVSKSPSLKSDRSNYSGINSLPRKSPILKASVSRTESLKKVADSALSANSSHDNDLSAPSTSHSNEALEDCQANSFSNEKSDVENVSDIEPPSASPIDSCQIVSTSESSSSDICIRRINEENSNKSISPLCQKSGDFIEAINKEQSATADHGKVGLSEEPFATEATPERASHSENNASHVRLSETSKSIEEVTAKKIPPPVPVKPDGVTAKANKNCGSKILTHLKNLEECSKFSRSSLVANIDLDGLKSLEERRKELKSCTGKKSDDTSVNKDVVTPMSKESSSDTNSEEKPKVPSSPLMSVRSFVSRNVASVSTSIRSSRSSSKPTVSFNSVTSNKPPVLKSSKKSDELSEDGSFSELKLSHSVVHTRGSVQSASITRRKSIKTIGSYISKLNSRSSSVPPRLDRPENKQSSLSDKYEHLRQDRTENRQSSLPNDSLISGGYDSGTESPTEELQQENTGTMTTSASLTEDLGRRGTSFETRKTVVVGGGPHSLPSAAADSDDNDVSSSSSNGGGVVIEKRRPKGWVRHVVGRLQQTETTKPNKSKEQVECS